MISQLRIPPLIVVVITGVLIRVVAKVAPALGFNIPLRIVVSVGIASVGLACAAWGSMTFRRVGTTVNPLKPQSASVLVTSGIYQHTRNPMYLGFLLVLVGWAIHRSNLLGFLFLPLFVIYMNRFQIQPEENALASLFGEEFQHYKSTVRRWI